MPKLETKLSNRAQTNYQVRDYVILLYTPNTVCGKHYLNRLSIDLTLGTEKLTDYVILLYTPNTVRGKHYLNIDYL